MDDRETSHEKVGSVGGVLDVGILAIAHFKNPARKEAFNFLSEVLRGERKCIIPLTTFFGAYHILTEYLGVDETECERSLRKTVWTKSSSFYEDVTPDQVLDALSFASGYNIESWDGYLVSLAKEFGAPIIYTTDRELSERVSGIEGTNPIPQDVFSEYKRWLEERMEEKGD